MKKLILVLAFIAVTIDTNAQVFVGGSAGVAYVGDFSAAIKTFAGYEFSQKFAVGGGLSAQYVDDGNPLVMVDAFARYNCWNNSHLFFDLTGKGSLELDHGCIEVGVVPSIRYRFSDHWDASADLGLIGYNTDVDFVVSAKSTNVCLNVIYRF